MARKMNDMHHNLIIPTLRYKMKLVRRFQSLSSLQDNQVQSLIKILIWSYGTIELYKLFIPVLWLK